MHKTPWPKAILFDLDDTLWPIAPVIVEAERRLYAWLQQHAPAVARRFSIEQLRQARMALLAREPAYQVDLAALRRAGLHAAFEEAGADRALVDGAMQQFLAARNDVQLYGEVLPALLRLRERALVGSISNGNADLVAIGLDGHFSVSVAAHQMGCAKPDPAIFLEACRRLGVAPADAVYVGDDLLLDVQGAQRAGLRAVWMNRGGSDAHLVQGIAPDAICASLDGLLAWLEAEHA